MQERRKQKGYVRWKVIEGASGRKGKGVGKGGGLEVCGCKLWLQAVVAQQKGEEVKEKEKWLFWGGGRRGLAAKPGGVDV